MMRRAEGCIDWIEHSTIHEDNKLSLLTSSCPASFPLSSHIYSSLPHSLICLFLSLAFEVSFFLTFGLVSLSGFLLI